MASGRQPHEEDVTMSFARICFTLGVFLNLCGSFPICVELGPIKRHHMGAEQFDAGRRI